MKGSLVSVAFSVVVLAVWGAPMAVSAAAPAMAAGTGAVSGIPFKGAFEGTQTVTPVTPPLASVEMHGEGEGTLVGRFEIALPHTVNFATSSATGICTIVAADGSTIVASFTGQAQIGPIVTIIEEATITGGTGRFADASGEFTIRRTYNPATGRTIGEFDGTLSLTK